MPEVKCLNPWDPQSKRQYQIDGVYATLNAGHAIGGQAHGICYAIDQQGGKGNCGYMKNVMPTLCSDSHGTPHALCYAIQGNVVDRSSAQSGSGWCEDVSPTLNTQDRHAVAFQLCGDRGNQSVSVSDTAYCIPANPMSDRGQAVCITIEGNGARPSQQGVGVFRRREDVHIEHN